MGGQAVSHQQNQVRNRLVNRRYYHPVSRRVGHHQSQVANLRAVLQGNHLDSLLGSRQLNLLENLLGSLQRILVHNPPLYRLDSLLVYPLHSHQ